MLLQTVGILANFFDILDGDHKREREGPSKTSWNIRYEDITLEAVIGKGAYGLVHKGKWRNVAVAGRLARQTIKSFQ